MKANKWALQYEQDLNHMNNTKEGEARLARLSPKGKGNFRKLFGDGEQKAEFCEYDLRELLEVPMAREVGEYSTAAVPGEVAEGPSDASDKWPYALQPVPSLTCSVCAATFGSEGELRWHLPSHLPWPENQAAKGKKTGAAGAGADLPEPKKENKKRETTYKKTTQAQALALMPTLVKAAAQGMSRIREFDFLEEMEAAAAEAWAEHEELVSW